MRATVGMIVMGALAGHVGQTLSAQVATTVRVRVVAHDAKIIGDGVGGARVIVRDAGTGTILAMGTQEGGTGDTRRIVKEPVSRGARVYDTRGAALFTVELQLYEPAIVEFIGEGPLGYEHAMLRASKTVLLVPGEDLLGDGLLLELHGFIVEMLEPTSITAGVEAVDVEARVRMMCGCPLEPGGLCDADRVRVRAQVYADGALVRDEELEYAGKTNMFRGSVSLADVPEGAYLIIVATDPDRENFGSSKKLKIEDYP